MSQVKMFYQVVIHETLQLGKLDIPPNFVDMHGESCLSGRWVLLVVPNGDTWPVGLERRDDGLVMLGAGWTEFARHYSIGLGYFIMFRFKHHHQSLPVFNVLILKESNGMEITYPRKPRAEGPFFEKILPRDRTMLVPANFIKEAGLQDETTLVLKGHTGERCRVNLNRKSNFVESKKLGVPKEYTKHFLGAGWSDFQNENGIEIGDILSFEHIGGSSIKVKKIVG